MGISVGDADVVDDEVDSASANGHTPGNGISPPDFSGASSPRSNGHVELDEPVALREAVRLLEPDWTEVPSSASLLQPYVDRPWPSRQDAFEHALQLRMSQLTLTEFVEGPESTGDKWVEVFQWFSERRSMVADDRTCSFRCIASYYLIFIFDQDERRSIVESRRTTFARHPCSQAGRDRTCGLLPCSRPSRSSRRACLRSRSSRSQSRSLRHLQWHTPLHSPKSNWAAVLHLILVPMLRCQRRLVCPSTRPAAKARRCGRCS